MLSMGVFTYNISKRSPFDYYCCLVILCLLFNLPKKFSHFNCADNFLTRSHPPRHQTTARCSPASICTRVDHARFNSAIPIPHAARTASRRRHYYSLTALLLFSGEDVCLQCIQGKNYKNVIALFTNHFKGPRRFFQGKNERFFFL